MNKLLILVISILNINITIAQDRDCVGYCMSKHQAAKMAKDKSKNYLKKYCNKKEINHIDLKQDLEKAHIGAYSLLNSRKFMKQYCNKEPIELISKCIKRICVKNNK